MFEWTPEQVHAVQAEQIKRHHRDRIRFREFGGSALVGDVHPLGECSEGRDAVGKSDDLAVDQCVLDSLCDHAQFGVTGGDVPATP